MIGEDGVAQHPFRSAIDGRMSIRTSMDVFPHSGTRRGAFILTGFRPTLIEFIYREELGLMRTPTNTSVLIVRSKVIECI